MAKSIVQNLAIERVTYSSVSPFDLTIPQVSCKISIKPMSLDRQLEHDHDVKLINSLLQNRFHIVLCYKKQSNVDCGWHVGGWIRESLGLALVEAGQTVLAGRVQGSGDGGLELVGNDSGVRLVEAQTTFTLAEFLESKTKVGEVIEPQLVCWTLDHLHPHFSPLFTIQVTNFQCGGYSIGISYSPLLSDPSVMAKFLNKWTNIHKNIAYEGENFKIPLFYAPNFKRVECSPPFIISSSGYKANNTIMFNITTNEKLNSGDEICMYLVLSCIKEVESKFGRNMTSNFTLIIKEPSGHIKVERTYKKHGNFGSPKGFTYEFNPLSWEDLRTNEMSFRGENVPVDVSYWVTCDSPEGVVLVVISSTNEGKYGMNVYITFSSGDD